MLLDCKDSQLADTLATSLRLILRNDGMEEKTERVSESGTGIDVVELSAEDFEKYFSSSGTDSM